MANEILKVDYYFIMTNEKGHTIARVDIDDGGCVIGQFDYVNKIKEHIAHYKKTDLKYIKKRKKKVQRRIDKLMSAFTIHIKEMAELEQNEKTCNAVPGKNV